MITQIQFYYFTIFHFTINLKNLSFIIVQNTSSVILNLIQDPGSFVLLGSMLLPLERGGWVGYDSNSIDSYNPPNPSYPRRGTKKTSNFSKSFFSIDRIFKPDQQEPELAELLAQLALQVRQVQLQELALQRG